MLNIAHLDPWQRSLFSRQRTPGKEPLLAGKGLGNIAASFCDFQVCWRAVLSVNHVGFAIGSIKKRKSLSRQRGKKLAVQGSSEMVVGYKLKFTPPGPQYLFSAV